jgi:hypothetical protein
METSEDWLSSDFIERLKKLDRGTLSFEFLRTTSHPLGVGFSRRILCLALRLRGRFGVRTSPR